MKKSNKNNKKGNIIRTIIDMVETMKALLEGHIIGILILLPLIHQDKICQVIDNVADYEITDDKMIDLINESKRLNEGEKKLLINKKLFNDIEEALNNGDNGIYVSYHLKNMDIVKMNKFEEKNFSNLIGFYSPILKPKKLNIRNYGDDVNCLSTVTHEFIHSLENCKYSYIREPFTVIVNSEYYYDDSNYSEEVKRLKVLMEIIGPEPIWKVAFSNDTSSLDNLLDCYLSEEDSKEIKKLFKRNIGTSLAINLVNERIDELLSVLYYNVYGMNIEDDEIIKAIYNDSIKSRNYFNITDDYDIIYEPVDKEIIEREGLLTCYYRLKKLYEIPKDEFDNYKFKGTCEIFEMFDSQYNYEFLGYGKIKIEVEPNNWKEYDIEEAEKLGYINTFYFVEELITTESIDEKNSLIEEGYMELSIGYSCSNDMYNIIKYNGEVTLGIEKEIPTIKDKFETGNVKKLVKE